MASERNPIWTGAGPLAGWLILLGAGLSGGLGGAFTIILVLPNYTTSITGPYYSTGQLVAVHLVIRAVYRVTTLIP